MPNQTTDRISLAAQFVNSTDSHIFLTGKAGTGKTTFLHNLATATHKKFLIVAPTGIAALNAGGVTIHSQFLLPFGIFQPGQIAGNDYQPQGPFYTQNDLTRRNPLNSLRKQVLRDIDLLVIDEVSMLRADLLDAIDFRLKAVKGNFRRSFGGVQLLMVGDLYQLPPIIKDFEWNILKEHYKSGYFYESLALKKDGFTYIELDKIFRQQDDKFINILNNLRDNKCRKEDIQELNKHYREEEKGNKEEIITITTHNNLANRLNQKALQNLPSKPFSYEAEITGKFPENLYPLPEILELKEGAQIMFVKNDTLEKRYFNGKLATVTKLGKKHINVIMAGEKKEYQLELHTWENKKYTLNPQKELEEEIIGTFTQYPVKLAWAITVHKSQGLTFEKAIIDVGQAFAPGQVYVAMSRLRSLEGLLLRTKITESVISSDEEVVRFSTSKNSQDPSKTLKQRQALYLKNLLLHSFDFSGVTKQIEYIQQKSAQKIEFEDAEMQHALNNLREKFLGEAQNTRRFQSQINNLLSTSNQEKLQERIKKGSEYYLNFLYSCLKDLLLHLEEIKQLSRIKTYQNALEEVDQMIVKNIDALQKATYITQCIFTETEIKQNEALKQQRKEKRKQLLTEIAAHIKANPKNSTTKTGRKRKKKTQKKGATYLETYSLLKDGLNAQQIAEKRSLVVGTIESHLAKGISNGDLEIFELMNEKELHEIKTILSSNSEAPLSEIYKSADGKFSYGKLRMVQAHLNNEH